MQLETFGPFEDSKLGIGLTYSSETKRFSLFKYDMGMERFDASSLEKFFHQSAQEAQQHAKTMLSCYEQFVTEVLALPVITGEKSELEWFAGAEVTHTLEMLMQMF